MQQRRERTEAFEQFHQQNTKFSSRSYVRLSDLNENPPEYDVYCVGSDQVWNPYSNTSLLPYFLSFVPEGKKKISYAASFGVARVPNAISKYYQYLASFSHIGVREQSAVSLVKQLTGRSATAVLDPTLLLSKNEWEAVALYEKVPSCGYVLIYALGEISYITQVALQIAQERHLRVVRICRGAFRPDRNKLVTDILNAGPADFLGLMSRAEIILTKSFHGTVFSVVFEKEFYTFICRTQNNNSRQLDLLRELGLLNRVTHIKEAFVAQRPIDYVGVKKQLYSALDKSVKFLKQAIDD
jgi:hypothetical protein